MAIPKTQSPQDIEKQLIEQQFSESQRAVDIAFNALVTSVPNNTFPEAIFKDHFLPYFAGQVVPNDKDNRAAQWIGIAGNPTREVDLVDNSGKVVLTVPSLFDTHALNPLRPVDRIPRGQKSMHEMLIETKLRDNHIKGAGQPYFHQNMNLRVDQIIESGGIGDSAHSDTATTQKWAKVFEHFGLDQQQIGNKTTGAANAADGEIDFDYT